MPVNLYEKVFRPFVFQLPAELDHDLAHRLLRQPWFWQGLRDRAFVSDPRLEVDLAGIPVVNPVGLAPGFDKNGDLLPSLAQLGFGYIVVGSITKDPRDGNPRPRLFRFTRQRSIVNSMGLPNRGLEAAMEVLARAREVAGRSRVIVSVAGFTSDELLEGAAAVANHVDGVEIGLVCPNTTKSERMEELQIFTRIADGLSGELEIPAFVKLPPHHSAEERSRVLEMVDVWIDRGLQGVSVNGGRQMREPRFASGRGSLAGRATYDDALRILRDVANHADGRLAIKASGGVFSGEDAAQMLRAGATTVELYTSFIYRGWDTARDINRELLAVLDQAAGADNVSALADEAAGAGT